MPLSLHVDKPNIYFGFIHNGYSWVFPNINKTVFGIGGMNSKHSSVLKCFSRFLNTLGVDDATKYSIKGHPIPYGNFLTQPTFGNTLLIGDSAGLADSLLGEGIYYSFLSAQLAAKSIIDSGNETNAVCAYVAHYHNSIEPLLKYWDTKANLLFKALAVPFFGRLAAKKLIRYKKKKLFNRICYGPTESALSKIKEIKS